MLYINVEIIDTIQNYISELYFETDRNADNLLVIKGNNLSIEDSIIQNVQNNQSGTCRRLLRPALTSRPFCRTYGCALRLTSIAAQTRLTDSGLAVNSPLHARFIILERGLTR